MNLPNGINSPFRSRFPEMEPTKCRFIRNDDMKAPLWCQANPMIGSPYCAEHSAACYRPKEEKL